MGEFETNQIDIATQCDYCHLQFVRSVEIFPLLFDIDQMYFYFQNVFVLIANYIWMVVGEIR